MNKVCTTIKQSRKLFELGIDIRSADMYYMYRHWEIDENTVGAQSDAHIGFNPDFYYGADNGKTYHYVPAWSLSALLKLIPKHISRKDRIHYDGQTFIPSFRWEISPTAIYYTDGNDIMDRVSFGYGENNMELIDAVFKMVCWLKEHGEI